MGLRTRAAAMAGEPVASHQAASGSSRSASESSFSQGIHAFLGQLPPSALTRMFDKQASLLPSTVVDQIRLWERERNRIKTAEGYLWDQFTSTEDFEVVVWANVDKRLLFVALDGQDQLKDFVM